MMDKNLILAILASMALIVVYNVYYEYRFGDYLTESQEQADVKAKEKDQAEREIGTKETPTTPDTPATPDTPVVESKTDSAPTAPAESTEPAPDETEIQSTGDEKLIRIKTGLTEVLLSNRGGSPVKYLLDKYHSEDHGKVDLRFDIDSYVAAKKANDDDVSELEKVKKYPLLGLKFDVSAFSDKINNAYYGVSEQREEITLEPGDDPVTIVFEYQDKSGVVIRKSYTFRPMSYEFDFSVMVRSTDKWKEFDYSLVMFGVKGEPIDQKMAARSYHGPVAIVNKTKEATAPDEDTPQISYRGTIKWAALTSRYYAISAMPETPESRSVVTRYIDKMNYSMEWKLKASVEGHREKFTFYAGPKENNILNKYDNGMYAIINYGWFDFIAKPLFWLMDKFHSVIGNWGWSIIALTVLMKLLFFPLTQKGFKSMRKLQKLQPHLKKIQEIYKDDKEKLNQAMMSLYKEHKVNPLGGCLPMILQIPIFFALYKTLLESIELKGAGWILWINDLSLMDPTYITPVLMGVSMLVQQLMTPKTGDATQRKIMMAMPFFFTFLFLTFPAGLVIYWLVNNILTIGQQWVINRGAD